MNQSEFLDRGEVHELTGYARAKAQAAWLQAERIPHRVVGSRVIVCRVHARAWVEGRATPLATGNLNWSAVR